MKKILSILAVCLVSCLSTAFATPQDDALAAKAAAVAKKAEFASVTVLTTDCAREIMEAAEADKDFERPNCADPSNDLDLGDAESGNGDFRRDGGNNIVQNANTVTVILAEDFMGYGNDFMDIPSYILAKERFESSESLYQQAIDAMIDAADKYDLAAEHYTNAENHYIAGMP